jgi:hypothetical protein
MLSEPNKSHFSKIFEFLYQKLDPSFNLTSSFKIEHVSVVVLCLNCVLASFSGIAYFRSSSIPSTIKNQWYSVFIRTIYLGSKGLACTRLVDWIDHGTWNSVIFFLQGIIPIRIITFVLSTHKKITSRFQSVLAWNKLIPCRQSCSICQSSLL